MKHGRHLFLWILSGALLFYLGIFLWQNVLCIASGGCMLFFDFNVAYLPARALVEGNLKDVYDIAMVERWMQGDDIFHPTLYPPYSLLWLYPLGWLTPLTAIICWFSLHIILLVWALRLHVIRQMYAGIAPFYTVLFLLPFCLFTLILGQTGMICTALFLLVFAWRWSHPVWAGIAFSFLCFKPQMALALAILLMQEKNRKALITLVLSLVIMTLASLALWGAQLWLAYIKISMLSAMVVSAAFPILADTMASVFTQARVWGISPAAAQLMQLGVTCATGITVWRALKHCRSDAEKLLLTVSATCLLTPYCYIYDTVLFIPVCYILAARISAGDNAFSARALLVILAFLPITAMKLQFMHIPYAIAAIVFAYGYAWKNVYSRAH